MHWEVDRRINDEEDEGFSAPALPERIWSPSLFIIGESAGNDD
jgi:hypothetical protein